MKRKYFVTEGRSAQKMMIMKITCRSKILICRTSYSLSRRLSLLLSSPPPPVSLYLSVTLSHSLSLSLSLSSAFLCVDEPAVKATFAVTIIVLAHHTAISNMPESAVAHIVGGKKKV